MFFINNRISNIIAQLDATLSKIYFLLYKWSISNQNCLKIKIKYFPFKLSYKLKKQEFDFFKDEVILLDFLKMSEDLKISRIK